MVQQHNTVYPCNDYTRTHGDSLPFMRIQLGNNKTIENERIVRIISIHNKIENRKTRHLSPFYSGLYSDKRYHVAVGTCAHSYTHAIAYVCESYMRAAQRTTMNENNTGEATGARNTCTQNTSRDTLSVCVANTKYTQRLSAVCRC